MTDPKWFPYPQEFKRETVTLLGTFIAGCGMIERCILNGILEMRERGVEAAKQPVRNEYAKRQKQWQDAAQVHFADSPDDLTILERLGTQTKALMGLRHILVHSFWFGQDEAGVLYLQQAKESKGEYLTRSFEIEMPYLAARGLALQPLVDDHMHFLHERIRKIPGDIQEVSTPAAWSPTRLKQPSRLKWPRSADEPQRLALKLKAVKRAPGE